MIVRIIRRFAGSRRSAVAVIMAISLVPLMLLVGIAVDFTFLYQTRTQTAFASQAAAAQALRIAAATYALEVSYDNAQVANGTLVATPAQINAAASERAIIAGQTAGNLWFASELGNLSRATMTSAPNALTSIANTNPNGPSVGAPTFMATVTDTSSYPPIFDPLFGSSANWSYVSTASGTTSYAYAQILLMLDTSGSMLIGADNTAAQPDIQTIEAGTVCPKQGYIVSVDGGTISGNAALSSGHYVYNASDGDQVLLSKITTYLSGGSDTNTGGSCAAGYGLLSPTSYDGSAAQSGTTAGTPCALACHFSSTKASDGYYADYYGMARRENDLSKAAGGPGVKLRLDVVFNATENVITDMQSSQAVAGQLSVGVYQFNTDVFPIVTGATGSGGKLPEATSDLTSALNAVNAVDYQKTPTETAIPQLINSNVVSTTPSSTVANTGGDSNFAMSLTDLQNGNPVALGAGGKKQPLTASGSGATATTPLKFMFIVTDGLEDDSSSNGDGVATAGYNVEGEMTSISGEKAGTGSCSYLKNTLGYTLFVLYVNYYPVANDAYYSVPTPGPRYTNAATNGDFQAYTNQSVRTITAGGSNTSATALALQACASNTSDFYEASSSQGIQDALASMLKSALASTIRLTN
jgi:hypothetical protein